MTDAERTAAAVLAAGLACFEDQFKSREPLWERTGPSAPSAEADPLDPKGQSGGTDVVFPGARGNKKRGIAELRQLAAARAGGAER